MLWYKDQYDQYVGNCQRNHVWTIKSTNVLFIWKVFELVYNFIVTNLIRFNWPWYAIGRAQNLRLTDDWIISIYLEASPLVYLCTLCHKHIHTLPWNLKNYDRIRDDLQVINRLSVWEMTKKAHSLFIIFPSKFYLYIKSDHHKAK